MKRPSHATIVAYLALFVALSGTAIAASQLPKNSVGPKQLRPNAVTGAKIKNGAITAAKVRADGLTGAQIDESTLGQVPSAAGATRAQSAATADSAESATSAATAANADALGGIPSSGFLKTGTVRFGTGALNACFEQQLIDVPGWFRIGTIGNCQNEFALRLSNLSDEEWLFIRESEVQGLAGGTASDVQLAGVKLAEIFAISASDPSRHALVDCAYQELSVPPRVSCSARIAPAA